MSKALLLTLLAIVSVIAIAITLCFPRILDTPTLRPGSTPPPIGAIQPRSSADRMKQPTADNANLAMMFWLEEQIEAYAEQLRRETNLERRRAVQAALDRSRAELAQLGGVVKVAPRATPQDIDSVRVSVDRP